MTQSANRILVPVGFSEQSLVALQFALPIAKKTNSEIVLLSVIEDAGLFARIFSSEVEKQQERMKKEVVNKLEELIEANKDSGVRMSQMTATGVVYEEIAEVAKMLDVNFVVMGTNGKPTNFRKSIIGSNAYRVVNNVEPPVITVGGDAKPGDFKKIIFPLVLDRRSREKVGPALHFARLYGAEIRVVGVSRSSEEADKLKANLKQVLAFVSEKGVPVDGEIIRDEGLGIAEATLLYSAKQDGDLIIIMEEGEEGKGLRLRSNDVEKIINNSSSIPVMSITPSKVKYESQWQNM